MTLRVLDKKALRAKGINHSNVHLLRLEKEEKFPRRFYLTENRVGWLEEDIDRWIRERVTASSPERQAVTARPRHAGNPAQRVAFGDEASAGTEVAGGGNARPAA